MSRKFFLIVTLSLFSAGTPLLQQVAKAETPLTRATVQSLRNQVQLIFKNRVTRAARNADTMTPGDSLATARKAFAELRFNDNSLARIGERALFQFIPNTRNFYLGNGTALLLIPPGQGRTNIRTPNAAAGIRGSALFVRYNEDTDTTIVGALTNSRIEVSNGDNPQGQTLKAGQMAVIVQNQVVQIYNFDLHTFYQTSELVKDLDLPLSNATPSADPGIAAVQAETSQAVREQMPLTGKVYENPAFVSLTPLPAVQAIVKPDVKTPTPIPSGFELGVAGQTIIPSTSAQPQPPTAAAQPSEDGSTSPGSNQGTPTTSLQPPVTAPPPPRPAPPPVTPAPAPPPPGTTTPAPQVPSTTVQPVTPAPPPVTPAPAPLPPYTTTPAPQVPSTTVQPVTTPLAPAPISAPGVTTPAPQLPTNTVQPSIPVTPTAAPAPISTPTAAPTPVVTTTPAPRPDPVTVPTPTPVLTQPTPAPSNPAADTPAAQPAVTAPAVSTPAPTTAGQTQ